MIKPIILTARCTVKSPPIEHALRSAYRNSEGDIDSDTLARNSWDITPFLEFLKLQGYKYRECEKYSPITLTYVNGSARWHEDPGFGPVACWLLFESDSSLDGAQLITRHGPVDMRAGDVCIFNANYGHAWICNGISVMMMVTVSPVKHRPSPVQLVSGGD